MNRPITAQLISQRWRDWSKATEQVDGGAPAKALAPASGLPATGAPPPSPGPRRPPGAGAHSPELPVILHGHTHLFPLTLAHFLPLLRAGMWTRGGKEGSVRGETPPGPPWPGRGGIRASSVPGLHQCGYSWGHPGPGPAPLQKACLPLPQVTMGCLHARVRGLRAKLQAGGKGGMTLRGGGSLTGGLALLLS